MTEDDAGLVLETFVDKVSTDDETELEVSVTVDKGRPDEETELELGAAVDKGIDDEEVTLEAVVDTFPFAVAFAEMLEFPVAAAFGFGAGADCGWLGF